MSCCEFQYWIYKCTFIYLTIVTLLEKNFISADIMKIMDAI